MTSSIHSDDLERLNALADGELDAASMAALQRRLETEPELRSRYEAILSLRQAIRAIPDDGVPLERLQTKAALAAHQPKAETRSSWRSLAAAALIGAALSATVTFASFQYNARQEVAAFAVSNHIRGLLAEKPFDVASSDRHTIKPWFTTKLPESPAVVDLGASGFTLAGGRVDVIAGDPVPTVVYRRGPHAISLTTLRGVRAIPQRSISGYNIKTWENDGLSYIAVSDLPPETLENFRQAFIAGTRN
jgi:anti-sigma factor RsiW